VSAPFGIREIRIRGFRSARSAVLSPRPVCGLIGGPGVGKSNVLAAIWMLLHRGAPDPGSRDVAAGHGTLELAATLANGGEMALTASPTGPVARSGPALPVAFLPAAERSGRLVADPDGGVFAAAAPESPSSAAPAVALLHAFEWLCGSGGAGHVVLIEEPELFLPPQRQRYLYRLLRDFAAAGNQVIYSTHSPAFLNVGRLEELAIVDWSPQTGTTIVQPERFPAEESFRAVSELDAERNELFLARAALLVEGRTEKLTFPFVFRALGHDADRECISIVECGGKPNLLLFVRICQAVGVPYVVVHDRDAPEGRKPILGEHILNGQIRALAGRERTVVLTPDFEGVAGMRGRRSHKPAHALARFADIAPDRIPAPLRDAVERVVAAAG